LRPSDIFRSHGAAWRRANAAGAEAPALLSQKEAPSGAGHLSLGQLKTMAAIEACRTAELGGHVA
jgi:hypothetical protein